jgi:Tfp pilus assembly protein PilF
MRSVWAGTCLLSIPFTLLAINAVSAFAQKGAAPSAGSAPSSNSGSLNRGTLSPNNPSNPTYGNSTSPGGTPQTGAIFLSGQVLFSDGTPPNMNIKVERVCGSGGTRFLAHTDSKGYFYVQLGQTDGFDADASDQPSNVRGFGSQSGNLNANRLNALANCDVRASYPGYRSDTVTLGYDRLMSGGFTDKINLTLHPLANVKGTTISVTTALAPKHAQKEYEKGMQLAAKGKFDEAQTHLTNATDTYPKYAIAWFALGELQQRSGKAPDARKSYEAAIAADSRYVSPYDQLALMSAQEGKWEDAANYSKRVIDLNPVEFPSSFWYNALANYNLKHFDDAEKSARQLLQVDSVHKYVQAESLLANLAMQKGDLAQAAAHLKAYLAAAPNAQDASKVRELLAKIDKDQAQGTK